MTSYPQVVVVRAPTPWVQSDSDITVLRHLEKMGCRLINRPQAILNCVNKFWTFQELAGHGVPLPDTFSYGESIRDRFIPFRRAAAFCRQHRGLLTRPASASQLMKSAKQLTTSQRWGGQTSSPRRIVPRESAQSTECRLSFPQRSA